MNGIGAPGKNRHPVDELADVREAKKSLEAREAELKAEISSLMGSADHFGGEEYIASQRVSTRKGGLDDKAMKAAGIDVDRFRKPDVTVYSLHVERREVEAA